MGKLGGDGGGSLDVAFAGLLCFIAWRHWNVFSFSFAIVFCWIGTVT